MSSCSKVKIQTDRQTHTHIHTHKHTHTQNENITSIAYAGGKNEAKLGMCSGHTRTIMEILGELDQSED